MSTVKTTNITHGSNTGTANMVLASNGNVTVAGALAATNHKVLNYVYESASTTVTTSGASRSELIDATITPSSASSKILVMGYVCIDITNHNSNAFAITYLYRGADGGSEIHEENIGVTSNVAVTLAATPWVIDSPSTTSAQEYTMSYARGSSGTSHIQNSAHCNYHLLLVELAG